ncbi:tetratricopeptide repeat protein [Caulobacter sp. S45]|uniref:tetratricopeptide repeat protein n=1 Tax=Caulobacter sp. S45 TaxID=1641861 RepID=UPI001576D215|nr:tetratricopeptide repeat protein [Caulobacter sp. S45]
MCRNPKPTATVLAALLVACALAGPAAAWPFGPSKPAAGAPPKADPAAAAAEPKKANAQERAAADRLDSLARSAFWAREAGIDPTDATAGVELAAALRALGRYPEASDAVSKVLVLYPDDVEALLESARTSVAASKGFYALEPLRRAEKVAPRDWRVYSLMAVAHDQNQQPDEARAAYGQALALSPDNPAVLSNLGLWYATHGQAAQGESYLRRAAAQPAASAQERQNLALVLGMEGKLADAESLMREDLPPDVAAGNMAYLQAATKVR